MSGSRVQGTASSPPSTAAPSIRAPPDTEIRALKLDGIPGAHARLRRSLHDDEAGRTVPLETL